MVGKIYDLFYFLCENLNFPFQKDDESNLKQFKIILNVTQKILICLCKLVQVSHFNVIYLIAYSFWQPANSM
jgi:hypothetical protein